MEKTLFAFALAGALMVPHVTAANERSTTGPASYDHAVARGWLGVEGAGTRRQMVA
jgi:hypothetical protein